MKKNLSINGESVEVLVKRLDGQVIAFEMEGKSYSFDVLSEERVQVEGKNCSFFYSAGQAVIGGRDLYVEEIRQGASVAVKNTSLSPMPGKILKVLVKKGDEVSEGQALVVMEAMKMEHTLKAAKEGVVRAVRCRVGERIEAGVGPVEIK